MKPVLQTRFGFPEEGDPRGGNCHRAAVASILELPLYRVPDFVNEWPSCWYEQLAKWLRPMGLVPVTVLISPDNKGWTPFEFYHLMSGPRPRNPKYLHCVVGLGGKMVHDPHPSGDGLVEVKDWDLFVAYDPATATSPQGG